MTVGFVSQLHAPASLMAVISSGMKVDHSSAYWHSALGGGGG